MIRRRLDPKRHGSAGYTTIMRLAALTALVGFAVVGTHMAAQGWYNGRILPGVVVAGEPVGGMTLAQARKVIQRQVAAYKLRLVVAGQQYELGAEALGVSFDVEATLNGAYRSGRDAWLPPLHQDPLTLDYRLDRSRLNIFASSVADRVGTPPIDAGVVLSGTKFASIPEKSGWSVDRMRLERLVEADVRSPGGTSLELKPHEQLADIRTEHLGPSIDEARQLMATPLILSYADKIFTPSPSDIGQWLDFQKQPDGLVFKLVPRVDTAKLKNYVQGVANKIDVAPVNKKVTVENGVSKVSQEGVLGIAVDQDPLVSAVAAAVSSQTPLTYAITTHPIDFKTVSTTLVSLDYGRYIEVNLSKQHLWAWQDHNVIYDTAITSGAAGAGLGTITGLFSIYYKTTNTRLMGYQYGYDYDVPVKYWMPFHQGYGLHDASWRKGNFGGQDYYYGGSHGCVNMPDSAAAFIYNWASVGTPVWVHK